MNVIKAALQKELKEAGWHSRGYLPHFDGGEIAQTVTFRLADSLPQAVLERWKRELATESPDNMDSILRKRIEYYLDQGYGSCALRDERVATTVQDSILHFDSERYRLSAWVIMPKPCASAADTVRDVVTISDYEGHEILHVARS